jgi:hypothetical protein
MLKQLRHKRFIKIMNEILSSFRCHWYIELNKNSELLGNMNDSNHQRPDCVHT